MEKSRLRAAILNAASRNAALVIKNAKIVNVFTEYSICWSSVMGVVYLVCVGVTSYVNGVQEPSSTLTMISGAASIAAFVLHVMQSIKLAKSFGKGVGYGIFLIILGPLARVILGLGDSEYIGQY